MTASRVGYTPAQRLTFSSADQTLPLKWEGTSPVVLLGVTVEVVSLGSGVDPEFSIQLAAKDLNPPSVELLTDETLAGVAAGRRVGWVPDSETVFSPSDEAVRIRGIDLNGGSIDVTVRYGYDPIAGSPARVPRPYKPVF